jgi:colanic acid biosynthesis glycosyl transferase WcaI
MSLRITFLIQYFDPEPGVFRGLPLARELVGAGHDVQVITGFPNYPGGKIYPGYRMSAWSRETMEGVPVIRVPLYPNHGSAVGRIANFASFALSASVLGPLLARPSDLVYVYHPPPTLGVPGAVFKGLRRTPLVYHIADMWPESVTESGILRSARARDLVGKILGPYCEWVYRQTQVITVLSPGFKRLLVERGVAGEKIEVVYNWVDDAVFRPVPRDERLASELGLAGKFNIVYAGIFGAFQGLDTVIRAAVKVKHLPDVQIVFVGDGVREAELKALAAGVGATNVRFVGRLAVGDMPKINALSDVLLVHLRDLPFFRATIPSKTQVSLASGRPIIMGVAGDAADVIRAADAGLVVPPEDPDALARAFVEMHAMDKGRREALGANGRRHYLEHMSLAVGARRMIQVFERARAEAAGGARPS